MYSVEEIERMIKGHDSCFRFPDGKTFADDPHHTCKIIIRQLLAERSQIRKQAFEEAADYVFKNNSMNTCVCDCPMGIVKALRRKAEEE